MNKSTAKLLFGGIAAIAGVKFEAPIISEYKKELTKHDIMAIEKAAAKRRRKLNKLTK